MDTSSPLYDVIVIGAGIMGSATAYTLIKRGCKVLLLEQFRLPHTRGSSHGQTRVIRKAYPENFYAEMTEEALEAWSSLERESGASLYRNTGVLIIGERGSPSLEETDLTLQRINCPHTRLSHRELQTLYPQFNYSENYEAVLDKTGGILWAGQALQAYQTEFKRRGGVIQDGEKVLEIMPGQSPVVVTSREKYKCNSVVITSGPWTNKVLHGIGLTLPLKTERIKLPYWKVATPGGMSVDNSPCMSEKVGPDSDNNFVFHCPSAEYPGHVKICEHVGREADPDNPDVVNQDAIIRGLSHYVRAHFPLVNADKPSIIESCMYTLTPDHHFILDHHPAWKNIVIGAGFSGHGFKMAPVVGKVLAQLSQGESPSYDLTPFRIGRFPSVKSTL